MQILPVLDLMNGLVVRGVAGQRDRYRPVISRLTDDPSPLSVARAIRECLGLSTFYVADLDAIQNDRPHHDIYTQLVEDGFQLHIDAGVRSVQAAADVLQAGARSIIAALETSAGPRQLSEFLERFGPERIIFSLDLKSGELLGDTRPWRTDEPRQLARQAVALGVTRMIVLDLAAVGMGSGLTTLPLCRTLKEEFPSLQIITGGGIRNAADLHALQTTAAIDALLIASALHNATITRPDLPPATSP